MKTTRRTSRRLEVRRILLASLAALVGVGSTMAMPQMASAETGPVRIDTKIDIVSDSTAPDPIDDGIIPTFDIATFRVNVSVNGANSNGNVVVAVRPTNGLIADYNPTTPAIDVPISCLMPGSAVSADRTQLNCNLGPIAQGTSIAFQYSAQAAGNGITNGAEMAGTVEVAGQVTDIPPLTIQGTPQVNVVKKDRGFATPTTKVTQGGVEGRVIPFRFEIQSAGASGKGGLPLQSVTFRDDISDITAKFPGATLLTTQPTSSCMSGQQLPLGPLSWYPPFSAAAPGNCDLSPGQSQTTANTIAQPGTWTYTRTGNTLNVSVTNIGNTPQPNGTVSSGSVMFFVPETSIPENVVTTATNRVTNVVGQIRNGGAVNEVITSDNSSAFSLNRTTAGATRNSRSAWMNSNEIGRFPFIGLPAIFGNVSQYARGVGSISNSGGLMKAYPGQRATAEAGSSGSLESNRYAASGSQDWMTCIKFADPVVPDGNPVAVVNSSTSFLFGPAGTGVYPNPSNTVIQYTTASLANSTTCNRAQDGWTTTRPAVYTGVRVISRVGSLRSRVLRDGERGAILNLQVPIKVRSNAVPGASLTRFSSATAMGSWNGSTYTVFDDSSSPFSGAGGWLGTDPETRYDYTNNTGNPRAGDRLLTAVANGQITKRVCGSTDGSTKIVPRNGYTDYCISALIEGTGPAIATRIVDKGGMGLPMNPMRFVPGSAVVTSTSGQVLTQQPTINGAGELTWNLGDVQPGTVTIRFQGFGTGSEGSSYQNSVLMSGTSFPQEAVNFDGTNTPYYSAQAVQFAAGRLQLHIQKSNSDVLLPVDTPTTWDLTWENQSDGVIGSVDLIDVLPYNGDTSLLRQPPSDFSGTTGLSGQLGLVSGQTGYYTNAAPASISESPLNPSNDPGGTTTWCTFSQFGDAGCPTDLADVTGIRVVDTNELRPDATRTVTIPMDLSGNAVGDVYTNDFGASVREGQDGPILPVRSNDATVRVAGTELSIVKSTEDTSFVPGGSYEYGITVANDGFLPATNVVVTDDLRPGLTYVSDDAGGTVTGQLVTWNLGTLAPGETKVITMQIKVDRPAPASLIVSGIIPNTARVTSTEDCIPGPDEEPNCSSTVENPPAQPHLTQNKVVDKATAEPGETLTYTVTVGNDGDAPATGVVASDEMPEEITYVASTASQGEVTVNDNGTFTWNIGTLPVGESVTVVFTATINDGEYGVSFENRVIAENNPEDCFGSECEPPTVENPCEDDNTFSCALTETPAPGLVQNKVVDKAEAAPGDELTYTLTVTNEGQAIAKDFTAQDTLPDGLTFVSATEGGENEGQNISWSFSSLAPTESISITVVATINEGVYSATLINPFKVTPPQGFPPPVVESPCEDDATFSCAETETPTPSFSQDKVVDKAEAKPGDELTYTLTITNTGPLAGAPTGAVDNLPDEVSFVEASDDGVHKDGVITWGELPEIAPGESHVLTVKAKVKDGQWNADFLNEFKVTPPEGFPPPEVGHPCEDDATFSCAPTKTPAEPGKPVDPPKPGNPFTRLPQTGAETLGMVAIGLALIGSGYVMVAIRRRKMA